MKTQIKKQFKSILGGVEGKIIVMISNSFESELMNWLEVYATLIAIAEDYEEYFEEDKLKE